MSQLQIVPIVEGHGEQEAVRVLLERLWRYLGGEYLSILRPIRQPKTKLIRPTELRRAVRLAALKIRASPSSLPGLILILLDADNDLPCELGPGLLEAARRENQNIDLACVLPTPEFETWFVAAAGSLTAHLDLLGETPPADPERDRLSKAWIERRFRKGKYSERIDQPRLSAAFDLGTCRERSASFDKLCRELEKRLESQQR